MTEEHKEATEKVRPLTATQVKNLEKLLDNDFRQMRADINSAAQEQQTRIEQEMRAEASWEVRDLLIEDGRNTLKEIRALRTDFIEKCRLAGFSVRNFPDILSMRFELSQEELERRITAEKAKVHSQMGIALDALQRQHTQALRQILVASVSTDAEKILMTLPSAADMLNAAAAEYTAKQQAPAALTAKVVIQ